MRATRAAKIFKLENLPNKTSKRITPEQYFFMKLNFSSMQEVKSTETARRLRLAVLNFLTLSIKEKNFK